MLDDFDPENTYVESINVVYASVMNLLLFLDICLYSMLQCPFFSITRLRRRLRLDFQGNLENDDLNKTNFLNYVLIIKIIKGADG